MKRLFLASIAILLFWSLVVPLWEYPDEQAHFTSVEFLVANSRMPKGTDIDTTAEVALSQTIMGTLRDERGNNKFTYRPENRHQFSPGLYGPREYDITQANNVSMRGEYVFKEGARYPPLYYRLAGFFYSLTDQASLFDRVWVVRLFSVILGAFNIVVAYKIAKEIWPQSNFPFIVAALVLLQPMMTFVMTGINSDVLHNLLFSLILLYSLRIIRYDTFGDSLFYALVFALLDYFTKPQAYIAIPIIMMALLIRMLYRREFWRPLTTLLILILLGALFSFFGGDNRIADFIMHGKVPFISSGVHPNAPNLADYARYSLDRLVSQNIVWYWGVFKWLGVVLPPIYWQIANRLVIVAAIGLLWGMIKKFTLEQRWQLIFLALASITYAVAIFLFDYFYIRANGVQVAVQARYYFPLLTAHMTLLLAGLTAYSGKAAIERVIAIGLVGFFIILQLGGLWTLIATYYDTASVQTLIIQASQYKPVFAKGMVWWGWTGAYLIALLYLVKRSLKSTT